MQRQNSTAESEPDPYVILCKESKIRHAPMAGSRSPVVWAHFICNLLLQLFDAVLTYQVLAAGVPEANPIVAAAIGFWGSVLGLLYCKTFACALLLLIFTLRHKRRELTIKAFTLTATVYGCVAVAGVYELLLQLGT
jgi:Domain of unknown function (DUF5658)